MRAKELERGRGLKVKYLDFIHILNERQFIKLILDANTSNNQKTDNKQSKIIMGLVLKTEFST